MLIDLAREARYDVMLVNDSDIRVPQHYLRDVTAPLAESNVGLVTCLYRAEAPPFAGQMEALGISTDFAPSTLVAPLVGVNEFGLGSTLVFRRADLHAICHFVGGDARLNFRVANDVESGLIQISHGIGKFPLSTLIESGRAFKIEDWVALSTKRHALKIRRQETAGPQR